MKSIIKDPSGTTAVVPLSHAKAYEAVRSRLMNAISRKHNQEPISVGEDFPIQQARVMDLMTLYNSLPNNAGAYGAAMMRQTLIRSFNLAIMGDKGNILELLAVYEELKGFK